MKGIPLRSVDRDHLKTNDPKKRMDVLKSSHDAGIVSDEEFENQKQKLDSEIENFNKESEKKTNNPEPQPEEPKKSDKALIMGLLFIVILLAAVFLISHFAKEEPKTIEETHLLNLQGKLKPEHGYVYKGLYSFITFDNQWYTQLKSPGGTKLYDLALRYSPRDVEQIDIKGVLDENMFNSKTEFYYTFNPRGTDFSYVALAVADFSTHMAKAFEKNPIAACDRNETSACAGKEVVTCDDTDKIVLYVNESDNAGVSYNGNCILVSGKGFDLVKGVDRVLYNLYNIMEQQEN